MRVADVRATRLGLLGLLALVLVVGSMALGHVVAAAAGWPVTLGQLVGLGLGISTLVLRRAYGST